MMFNPIITVICFFLSFPAIAVAQISKEASSLVREERTVTVDGIKERWRLEWLHPPKPTCSPERGYWNWGTCPCRGFAFGESGKLDLVRIRPGAAEDRLPLTPLFSEVNVEHPGAGVVLCRWPMLDTDDEEQSRKPGFAARVRSRPQVSVMKFADYNHDGQAAEFVLQVGAGPCGHQQCVLVGIDSRNPRLHVFGTVKHPGRPLILEHPSGWERLLRSNGDVTVVEVSCGDHGSDTQTEIRLRTDADGIHATKFVYECGKDLKRGQFMSQEDY